MVTAVKEKEERMVIDSPRSFPGEREERFKPELCGMMDMRQSLMGNYQTFFMQCLEAHINTMRMWGEMTFTMWHSVLDTSMNMHKEGKHMLTEYAEMYQNISEKCHQRGSKHIETLFSSRKH